MLVVVFNYKSEHTIGEKFFWSSLKSDQVNALIWRIRGLSSAICFMIWINWIFFFVVVVEEDILTAAVCSIICFLVLDIIGKY